MDIDKRRAVTAWLRDQGIRDPESITEAEHAELRTLLAPHKGFGIFWSMLMFERERAALALTSINLNTPQGASTASQLQGMIKSVDAWRELILNIADPIVEGSDEADGAETRAGVLFNG